MIPILYKGISSDNFSAHTVDLFNDKKTYEIHIFHDLPYRFIESYNSNTNGDFDEDLWEFIKSLDQNVKYPSITKHGYNDADGDVYIYLHIKSMDDQGNNVDKNSDIARKNSKSYVNMLLDKLQGEYNLVWSRYNVPKLSMIIKNKLRNPKFTALSTYSYIKSHPNKDMHPVIDFIFG